MVKLRRVPLLITAALVAAVVMLLSLTACTRSDDTSGDGILITDPPTNAAEDFNSQDNGDNLPDPPPDVGFLFLPEDTVTIRDESENVLLNNQFISNLETVLADGGLYGIIFTLTDAGVNTFMETVSFMDGESFYLYFDDTPMSRSDLNEGIVNKTFAFGNVFTEDEANYLVRNIQVRLGLEQEPAQTPEPVPIVSYPTQQQTFTIKNSDGYTVEVTVDLGAWIKASEREFLDGAWTSLGGNTTASAYTSMMGYFTDSDPAFHTEHSAIAFGKVSLLNVTPNFPVSESLTLSPTLWITANTQGMGRSVIDSGIPRNLLGAWAVYSSGLTNMYWAHNTYTINARMNQDRWGPILIAFSLDKVFTPNHPDGNPSISDVTITFAGSGHGSNNWMGSVLEAATAIFTPEITW